MLNFVKGILRNHYVNYRGWKTNRKIVVIESDDWGAVRMPSLGVLNELQDSGYDTGLCHYVSNDALASETDLLKLFDILEEIGKIHGSTPVITANTIMANPDFEKIRQSGFKEYFYRWFPETLQQYPEHQNSLNIWMEGIESGIFRPQLHGREHLQVYRWLRDLQNGVVITKKSFEKEFYGISTPMSDDLKESYLSAFDVENEEQQEFMSTSIREATDKFNELFGFRSTSAVAPNYTWNDKIEEVLHECGVNYLQGGRVQQLPSLGTGQKKHIRHHIGEKNERGQIYGVRNCTFEPSSDHSKDWIKSCMSEIRASFLWKRPAVIESHRVNYIGFIHPENRDRNLVLFRQLLHSITEEWPDVEFMSTDQLAELIRMDSAG